MLEFEHGILDIIEAGALVWLQSGHSERAIAVYQALLEFNLFRWVVMTVRVRVIYMVLVTAPTLMCAGTTVWTTDSACLSLSGTAG